MTENGKVMFPLPESFIVWGGGGGGFEAFRNVQCYEGGLAFHLS